VDRRALDEEVIPDVGAFQLRPNSIEGHGDEVPLRVDVVAADQQLELPRSRFKHIRLVRRPGVADLDEDRIRAVFLRPVANARQVDDPVRVREDIDGVRFAGQLVRRLQQPTVQFRPRADPPLTARVPLVNLQNAHPHASCRGSASVVETQPDEGGGLARIDSLRHDAVADLIRQRSVAKEQMHARTASPTVPPRPVATMTPNPKATIHSNPHGVRHLASAAYLNSGDGFTSTAGFLMLPSSWWTGWKGLRGA